MPLISPLMPVPKALGRVSSQNCFHLPEKCYLIVYMCLCMSTSELCSERVYDVTMCYDVTVHMLDALTEMQS